MTAQEFSAAFGENAIGAIEAFIAGLNDVERNGASASVILQQMDLDDIRLANTIKALASSKGLSVNAYMQDLVRKDQCGLFDTMQIAEKNREMISGITGNMHDGYDIIFKDGHSCHCRTKKDVRSCIIEYCNEKGD